MKMGEMLRVSAMINCPLCNRFGNRGPDTAVHSMQCQVTPTATKAAAPAYFAAISYQRCNAPAAHVVCMGMLPERWIE